MKVYKYIRFDHSNKIDNIMMKRILEKAFNFFLEIQTLDFDF